MKEIRLFFVESNIFWMIFTSRWWRDQSSYLRDGDSSFGVNYNQLRWYQVPREVTTPTGHIKYYTSLTRCFIFCILFFFGTRSVWDILSTIDRFTFFNKRIYMNLSLKQAAPIHTWPISRRKSLSSTGRKTFGPSLRTECCTCRSRTSQALW